MLKRDCEVTEIPSGKKITFFSGTEVLLMQSLGGTFTVVTHQGVMASIQGKDADALGKEVPAEALQPPVSAELEGDVEKQVWAKLKTCFDPEIPHNIVDLGLIYECQVQPVDAGHTVRIKMTLTAPGCGMGEWLKQDVRNKILAIGGVKEAQVDVVFEPPWDRSKMHPALRREFGW